MPCLSLGEAMKRRSGGGGGRVKARGGKAARSTRRNAPKDKRDRGGSIAGQGTVVARLTRERDQALLRKTANSEILRLISTSPGDLDLVCLGASTRKQRTVFSPSALAASSRCRPSTSTNRAPSARTRIGACWPLSSMLVAISSTRF